MLELSDKFWKWKWYTWAYWWIEPMNGVAPPTSRMACFIVDSFGCAIDTIFGIEWVGSNFAERRMLIDRRCWLTGTRDDWQEQEQSRDTATASRMWKSNLHLDKHDKATSMGAVLGASVISQSTVGFFPFERWPYTFVWVLSFVINLAAIPERSAWECSIFIPQDNRSW